MMSTQGLPFLVADYSASVKVDFVADNDATNFLIDWSFWIDDYLLISSYQWATLSKLYLSVMS